MTILIKQATPADASAIAPLIYNAIGDIMYRLTGEQEEATSLTTLATLVEQTNNRHSYTNTFVATENDEIVGILVIYNGKDGATLDRALEKWLAAKGAYATIDLEAYDDEYYIDTISVAETARGKGIGTKLFAFAEVLAKEQGFKKLSLNVETAKHDARRLYERLGFVETEMIPIIDEPFHHMVKQLD